uniref:Disease resistance protein RPS2 n=1 Tax=Aegilops tauschii TaxID=37682 RepID=R7W8Q6_AEGTA
MEFVASIVDTAFRPLKDYFARTFGYVMSCADYIDALGHEVDELKSKRDDVKRMVDAAERQGMEATSQVKWWLECVARLEDAAARIHAEYQARLQLPPDQAPGLRATYRLSQRADETLAEAAGLKDKGDFHKVADELVQVRFEEMPSAPVVGMDEMLQELHACVRGGDVGVVGVYGMGGIGKTALLHKMEDVCNRMDVRRKLKMERLPPMAAWELFCDKVGEHLVRAAPEIWRPARGVAMKCGGLPLALITVGRAMASKHTVKEWKHAITVLNIAPWQLLGMELDLLMPLKSSYDNLPSDKLRLCLLYCSLFPEDFIISKDWVIGYCIGEGFIDDLYTEMDEIYNKGHDLLGDLEIASLLEKGKDDEHISMHPMVRAMALWIASEFGTKETKWLVRAWVGLKEAPGAEKWNEAERICFMRNNIVELYETPNCPLLKTLMLQNNAGLKKLCDGFFQFMPSLRVLDLSHTSITELPSGISALVQLQYLDLYHTYIKSLPRELGSLVSLRFLLLSHMPLVMIPGGVIDSLKMLQVLYMDFSYGDWKVGESGNGVDFQELESLRRLKAIDITVQSVEALERLARSYRLAGTTRNLMIKACGGLTKIELPSSHLWKTMTNLKRVWIANCSNLAEVIIDGSEETDCPILDPCDFMRMGEVIECEQPALDSLQGIILQSLLKVKIVYRGGCVENLSSLFIWYCLGLEELITLSDGDQEAAANEDEQAAGTTSKVITPFPKLKELYLQGLPNLRALSSSACMLRFPSLKRLKIVDCPSLKRLKLVDAELKVIQCARDWFDGLEWDDDEVKASYEPLLDERYE